ncbi:polysaccharide lyase family 8 super-sandwich domain-containing protein [Paenibacillus sp. N3.4]|uniref:polysaccharide lyase family 8 super-sandwich domain-containing protein n=1 Tax=Paenibacillus sp. N3.4 TaxID=2603222 RepID=UPI0016502EC0|nr:polysaccharide lyase family 8 super-sandwich domain-containing protein [Paenibacillus sp. N3.4]
MIVSLLLVFAIVFSFAPHIFALENSASDEFDVLREKWFYQITGGRDFDVNDVDIKTYIRDNVDAKADDTYIGFVKADIQNGIDKRAYIWPDLPMVAQIANDRTASSQITLTYDRLKTLALAYNTRGSKYYHQEELKTDIIKALDWMYYEGRRYNESPYIGKLSKPQNATTPYGNWYDWEIGTPLRYLDTIILMYDELTPKQILDFMKPLDRFSPNVGNNTGANRVWKAGIVAESGIIQKMASKLVHAKGAMVEAFTLVKSGDGFYSDGSFIQHSYYPYTGGYGKALLVTVAPLMAVLHGSTWELSYPDHLEQKFYDMVFEAYEPFIYNGVMMDMVRNREISRAGGQDHITGRQIIRALITMSGVLPAGQKERSLSMLKYFIEHDTEKQIYNDPIGWFLEYYVALPHILEAKKILADNSISSRGELIKQKRFPSMDRVVHLRPGFAFGLAMYSDRVRTYEVVNEEGFNMWHTADGMTYLYNADVKRYSDDFWGTVDHSRLAGTTIGQIANPANNYRSGTANPNTWVGGTDISGLYGVSGMQLKNEADSKKSWFMFDDEIVALGSGITSTAGVPIETIVENVKIKDDASNPIVINGVNIPTDLGATKVNENVKWMHIAGNVAGSDVGYYFPTPTSLTGKKETRTQSWLLMNTYEKFKDPNPRTKSFATFWFDHGNNPVNAAYDYVLLPGKSVEETKAYSQHPDISIVENSQNAHAVKKSKLGLFAANFWNDIEYQVGNVKVDKKASVMVKESGGKVDISVSDPTQKNTGSIIVEVDAATGDVISKDDEITVLQSAPTLKIQVDVKGKAGQTLHIQLRKAASTDKMSASLHGDTNVIAGNSFSLTYGLEHVNDSLYAQDLTFTFDPDKVKFVSAKSAKQGFEIVGTKESQGQVRILGASFGEGKEVKADGDLVKLNFVAKPLHAQTEAAISLSNAVVSNGKGEETLLDGVSHNVSITYTVSVDKTTLNALIVNAQSTHDGAVEGSHVGQYPVGSKTLLQAAIQRAKAVADNTAATQQQVDQATADLESALQTFKSSIITSIPGDVNKDGKVTIGDLAIVAKYYGKSKHDSDWDLCKFADVNNDGVIDIEDLVFIARLIIVD